MPTSSQAGSSSKRLEHQWTSEQTYNLLDLVLSNPKYTQTLFPTPGHTPAPGISERYAKTLCISILDGTIWMDRMKQSGWVVVKEGKLKIGRKWDGDDPVTNRLNELPDMALHYEDRLGGMTRYEDIPPGSEYARRWRKYERCPERKWVLKYFALKRIQADRSMMVDPESLLEGGPSSGTAPAKKRKSEGAGKGSSSRSGKRVSILPDPPSPSKRKRPTPNGSSNTHTSIGKSSNPEKQKEVIYVLDSDSDEEPIPIRSKTRQTNRKPSPTFVGSDSDSEIESDDDIRSVSPPIVTLPYRSFALPPPDSPVRGTIPSPVRLAFQNPIDDIPTDSEDEEINPPPRRGTGMGMGMGIFSTISLTTNEDLVGMFTDPNLRPQQAWRNNLPTPPGSRGSGSRSPIKAAGRVWDSALTPEPEVRVRARSREDMDIESGLDNDLSEGPDLDRPITPPLPHATLPPDDSLVLREHQAVVRSGKERPSIPSRTDLQDNHPITPPLPSHLVRQNIQQPASDITENEDVYHNPTEAEREIAARLLRTLTGDHQTSQDIATTSVEQYPQTTVHEHEESSTGALADWITSHTGSSLAFTQGRSVVEKGRERRPLLDRMAPGVHKGKGKEVEFPANRDVEFRDTNIERTSYSAGVNTMISLTPTNRPRSSSPSATPPMDATSIHKATFQVASSVLDLLIALTQSSSHQHLSGYVIAFAPGYVPFKPKLAVFIIALGGVILEDCQVRSLNGKRFIIHPIGKGGGGMVHGLEEVDVLGFLEIIGTNIRGSA